MDNLKELSIAEIEQGLKNLPGKIHDAGQMVIEAEEALEQAINQLQGKLADIRIERYEFNPDMPSKMIEAYAVKGTDAERQAMAEARKVLEIAKLARDLLDNKLLSIKKIANLRNIYQA